jgi:putative component of membrane protein insertase Oxa1/YidC/SpoIIIJ protein YidD
MHKLALLLIHICRFSIRIVMAQFCRFYFNYPSSCHAIEAIQRFGFVCNDWLKQNYRSCRHSWLARGYDQVPPDQSQAPTS